MKMIFVLSGYDLTFGSNRKPKPSHELAILRLERLELASACGLTERELSIFVRECTVQIKNQ